MQYNNARNKTKQNSLLRSKSFCFRAVASLCFLFSLQLGFFWTNKQQPSSTISEHISSNPLTTQSQTPNSAMFLLLSQLFLCFTLVYAQNSTTAAETSTSSSTTTPSPTPAPPTTPAPTASNTASVAEFVALAGRGFACASVHQCDWRAVQGTRDDTRSWLILQVCQGKSCSQ